MNEVTSAYPILGFTEPFSSWTHLCAALVFLCLGVISLAKRVTILAHFGSIAVFTVCCVFLLLMSGLYHSLPQHSQSRELLCHLDHAGIYLLIAGTFTAIHNTLFRGWLRFGAIRIIWLLVVSGITLKMIFYQHIPEELDLAIYLSLGWMGIISGVAIVNLYGFTFVKPLLYGGLAYTAGALIEFFWQPQLIPGVIGPHECFHIAVLIGITCHFVFIQRCLDVAEPVHGIILDHSKKILPTRVICPNNS